MGQIPWARVLVEGLVIVLSILLALAADAWWEAGQDGQEEVQILSDLAQEFSAHQAEMDRQISRTNEKRAAAETLLSWMADDDSALGRTTLDSLWGEIVTTTGFDPATGAYDATVTSGRLELVQDRELRKAISEWPHVVDEVTNSEEAIKAIVLDLVVPELIAGGAPLSGALASTVYEWGAPILEETPAVVAYRQLRTNQDLRAALEYRYSWTTGLLGDYVDTAEFVDQVLDLIDAGAGR